MHPRLAALAERSLGLFTTSQALGAGYSHSEIRSLCRAGRWTRIRRGVLTTAETVAVAEERGHRFDLECLAVLLSLDRPSAVLSHATAAHVWSLPTPRDGLSPIRLTDPTEWRRGTGYVMTQAPLTPAERWRCGPLRLTSATRTLVDCAREWPLEDAVVAMDAGLLAERTTSAELVAATAAISRWTGAAGARRAAALANGRAESVLETRGRLRIVGARLPVPQLQVEIRTDRRLVAVVDAWYDRAAVAVEFDGKIKYTQPWRGRTPERVLWDEKRREDELRALDIRVVRVADQDLGAVRWKAVEHRLRGMVTSPGPAVRRFTAIPRSRGVVRSA